MSDCEKCKYYHDNCDAKFRCRIDVEQIRADAIDDAICEIQEAELMEAEKLIVISILEQLKNTDNCEVIEVKE